MTRGALSLGLSLGMNATGIIRSKPDGSFVEVLPDGTERPYEAPDTDWDVLRAMSDEDAHAAALADPDNQPLPARGSGAMLARRARAATGLSQAAFAARYGIPPGSLRDWEQGRRAPDKAAQSYLRVIARMPEEVAKALGDAA